MRKDRPYGAITTIKQALDLIKKAPVTIYRVNNSTARPRNYIRPIHVRVITPGSTVTTDTMGGHFISYMYDELNWSGININSKEHVFGYIFENYWHAYAYTLKLRDKAKPNEDI